MNAPTPSNWPLVPRALALLAGACALFIVAVAALVIRQQLYSQADALDSTALSGLREKLAEAPEDESIKSELRAADAAVRHGYFAQRRVVARGARMMLVATLVLLGALKLRDTILKTPRLPVAPPPSFRAAQRRALAGQAAIGVLAVGSIALLAGMSGSAAPPAAPAVAQAGVDPIPSREVWLANWPAFRGPLFTGQAGAMPAPTGWDQASGRNILWKSAVGLPGNNSPIVWDGRVFLTGATDRRREVLCFSAADGRLLWQRAVGLPATIAPKVADEAGHAPNTAATDGRRVFAIFPTGELAAVTFDGAIAWEAALGVPQNTYGHAASLAARDGRLIVQLDQGDKPGRSVLYCFEGASGKLLWKTPRPVASSWSTPIIIDAAEGPQVITAASPWVIGYALDDGHERWRAKVLSGEVAASPAADGDRVIVGNEGADLCAIRTDGNGDVTSTHVAWKVADGLSDITSPLVCGRRIYSIATGGALVCLAAQSGKMLWSEDLAGTFHASPVAAGDVVYVTNTEGLTYVLAAGDSYKLLGTAPLADKISASAAIAGGRIYLRGSASLYCIGGAH